MHQGSRAIGVEPSDGADTNAQKADGITSLMLAAGQNRSTTLNALLNAGADPTVQDHQGWTVLHIAATRNFGVPCKHLLEAGASQIVKNSEQETPFGAAVDRGMKRAIQAFRDYNGESVNGSAVVEVTRKTFKDVVGKDKPVLVEFYSPYCEHCKKFAPVYEEIAHTMHAAGEVIVAKANAAADGTFAGQHSVSAFPTIKWYPKRMREGEQWKGSRMYDAVMHFINEKLEHSV